MPIVAGSAIAGGGLTLLIACDFDRVCNINSAVLAKPLSSRFILVQGSAESLLLITKEHWNLSSRSELQR